MMLPKPSGEFEWVQASWGYALVCTPLAAIADHLFTTRLAGDGMPANDDVRWEDIAGQLGLPPSALGRMRQVHGAAVFEPPSSAAAAMGEAAAPEADIAITRRQDLALTVKAADCVPTLLADPRTGTVAAVHAGWRGTAAGAAAVAVTEMARRHGVRALDVVAAVGPSIGPCCYEVGSELMPHFAAHEGSARWFSGSPRPHLDLWTATREQLEGAGVPARQVHVSGLCTFEYPALLHSYRRDGAAAGRLVAAIRSGPGKTP